MRGAGDAEGVTLSGKRTVVLTSLWRDFQQEAPKEQTAYPVAVKLSGKRTEESV